MGSTVLRRRRGGLRDAFLLVRHVSIRSRRGRGSMDHADIHVEIAAALPGATASVAPGRPLAILRGTGIDIQSSSHTSIGNTGLLGTGLKRAARDFTAAGALLLGVLRCVFDHRRYFLRTRFV